MRAVDAGELVADDPCGHAEPVIDGPHPSATDPRKVVIGGDEVTSVADECIEIEG